MLVSLKRAGYFDKCKGLIVGDFSDLRKNTTPFGKNLKLMILDAVKDFDFPVLFFISSKVIRSAHAAQMTQSGLLDFGSGFLTLVVGL